MQWYAMELCQIWIINEGLLVYIFILKEALNEADARVQGGQVVCLN